MSSEMRWVQIWIDDDARPPKIVRMEILYERPHDSEELTDFVTAEGHATTTYLIEFDETTDRGIDITDRYDHGTWMQPTDSEINITKERERT